MKVGLKTTQHYVPRQAVLWLLLFLLPAIFFCGCDSCFGRRPPAGPPAVQSPVTALPAPTSQTPVSPVFTQVQTPVTPVPEPTTLSEPADEPDITHSPAQFDTSLISEVKPGMTYEEVRQILGNPGVVIAGTDQQNLVYRWSHTGQSFMGRFEDGKLIRKNIYNADASGETLDEETLQFDRELIDMIQPGMSFEEVLMIIGMDAQPLTSSSDGVQLYKWTDDHGSSITARFENQVLKRKSGMIVDTNASQTTATTQSEDQESPTPMDAPETYWGDEDNFPDDMPDPDSAPPSQVAESAPQNIPSAVQQRRVHVVGAERRERQIAEDPSPFAGRSYRPTVKLPEFKRRLRSGAYEIRIYNTTGSRASIAIISDEGGLELSIPANSRTSTRVNRGTYQFYFIYDDNPYTLHQGQRIPVAEALTDFVVYLFDDSSEVNLM